MIMLSDNEVEAVLALIDAPVDEQQAAEHARRVKQASQVSRRFREDNLPMAPQHRWPMEKFLLSQREALPSRKAYPGIFRELRARLAS